MSQSTREKLINAGKKLFAEKGYYKTTVEDITKNAGVSHGTFYVHFKSKKEFFLEILRDIRALIIYYLDKGIENKNSKQFFLESFEEALKEKEIIKIFFFEAICSDKDFVRFYSESKRIFMEKIKGFLTLIGKEEPELYAEIIHSYAKHLFEDAVITNREVVKRWKEFLRYFSLL